MLSKIFSNKVVLVTGSSSGIGRSTAIKFAQQGAKVVITGRRSDAIQDTLDQCRSIGSDGSDLLGLDGEITDPQFLDHLVSQTISKFGKLNILINNAGGLEIDASGKSGWEMSIDVMDRQLSSNFRSVMLLTQKSIGHLIKSQGDVVNVSTILSLPSIGVTSVPYYAVAKAALDHMSRSMAHQYIHQGVRINSVSPGLTSTSFYSRLGGDEETTRKMEDNVSNDRSLIPLGRVASPDDVAETILFLADRRRSECIIGQNIVVDGGSSLCCNIDTMNVKDKI